MNTKFIATLLIASSASLAAPAFASGYGPAPFYRPDDGGPASQRGQSAQTLAVEEAQARMMDERHSGVGGDEPVRYESAGPSMADNTNPMYRGN
ncbi:hypothetical protein GCT13_30370 [Paraburkholderia sp. CNPSo 3157]|uniref:DUF4148 domain-containing protein n=1 Tax=Paraburkholderia franconis TaxID=2654983 RepID=A0A7X1NFK0_9BURK|nr:hypothetical protein [Paraburkholderia franconis]MPW21063.1 hypothetical protein [Paraburkholderia franconis]